MVEGYTRKSGFAAARSAATASGWRSRGGERRRVNPKTESLDPRPSAWLGPQQMAECSYRPARLEYMPSQKRKMQAGPESVRIPSSPGHSPGHESQLPPTPCESPEAARAGPASSSSSSVCECSRTLSSRHSGRRQRIAEAKGPGAPPPVGRGAGSGSRIWIGGRRARVTWGACTSEGTPRKLPVE